MCNINLPYSVYTTNDLLITNAPYIDSCEELEALLDSNTNNKYKVVNNLENQNFPFLKENFDFSQNHKSEVIDNITIAFIVIIAIIMFIVSIQRK